MSTFIKITLAVLVVLGVGLAAKGITHFVVEQQLVQNNSVSQTNKNPANFTKQEYLDLAVPNCVKDGFTTATCKCFYSTMIDNHGVKGTYKFDLDAVSSSYVPTEEVTNLISKCMDAV